jgi:hypothetical protein
MNTLNDLCKVTVANGRPGRLVPLLSLRVERLFLLEGLLYHVIEDGCVLVHLCVHLPPEAGADGHFADVAHVYAIDKLKLNPV